jgi:cytoskeleton protein RodZ
MTEGEIPSTSVAAEARTAGAILRAARERQGLHIAALAAAIKVPPAKLDALEHGRYDELTDNTFARALAQSVCRVLKIDPKPVLDLLPAAGAGHLEKVGGGVKARFRERPGAGDGDEARLWHSPVFWVVLLLLVAAAAFVWWPRRGVSAPSAAPPGAATPSASPVPRPGIAPTKAAETAAAKSSEAVAPAPELAASVPTVVTETVHSAPPAAASEPALPIGAMVLRASEPSWVEVSDARGGVLLSRTLQPGESVGLDGTPPWKLTIGNGPATEVLLRGKKVALAQPGRDNVVRMDLR